MDQKARELASYLIKYRKDPGDTLDKMKWQFNESVLTPVKLNGHIYKLNKGSGQDKLMFLVKIRNFITELCNKISENDNIGPSKERVELFLQVHGDNEGRNYMLSEIPQGPGIPKSVFNGLNVPKNRYVSDEIPIGRDGPLRAQYRDIFLDLNQFDIGLLIHELAHTMCNHVTYRDKENHLEDFNECESFLKKISGTRY